MFDVSLVNLGFFASSSSTVSQHKDLLNQSNRMWAMFFSHSLSGFHFPGCSGVSQQTCEDECDIMVPGKQLGHSPPPSQRDDLCWPRGL